MKEFVDQEQKIWASRLLVLQGEDTKDLEQKVEENRIQETDSDLKHWMPLLFESVIPRLLDPLEAKGRSLKPVLVHGDFTGSNITVHAKTGLTTIFDPAPLWAHNECNQPSDI